MEKTVTLADISQQIKQLPELLSNHLLQNYAQINNMKVKIFELVWKKKVFTNSWTGPSSDSEQTLLRLGTIVNEVTKMTSLTLLDELLHYLLKVEEDKKITNLDEILDQIQNLNYRSKLGTILPSSISKQLIVYHDEDFKSILPTLEIFKKYELIPLTKHTSSGLTSVLLLNDSSYSVTTKIPIVPKITQKIILVLGLNKSWKVDEQQYVIALKNAGAHQVDVVRLPYIWVNSARSFYEKDKSEAMEKLDTLLIRSFSSSALQVLKFNPSSSLRYEEVMIPYTATYITDNVTVKGDWDWNFPISCKPDIRQGVKYFIGRIPVKTYSTSFLFVVGNGTNSPKYYTSPLYPVQKDANGNRNNQIVWSSMSGSYSYTPVTPPTLHAYVDPDVKEEGESLFSSYTYLPLEFNSATDTSFLVFLEYTRLSPERFREKLSKVPKITQKVIAIVLTTPNAIPNEDTVKNEIIQKGATEVIVCLADYNTTTSSVDANIKNQLRAQISAIFS